MCPKAAAFPQGIEPLEGEHVIKEAVPFGPFPRATRLANWLFDVAGSLYLTNRRLLFLPKYGPLSPSAFRRNLEWNLIDVAKVQEHRTGFLKPPLGFLIVYGLVPLGNWFHSRVAVSFARGERQVFIVARAAQWAEALRAAMAQAKGEATP
jgi:hypothetical protein